MEDVVELPEYDHYKDFYDQIDLATKKFITIQNSESIYDPVTALQMEEPSDF